MTLLTQSQINKAVCYSSSGYTLNRNVTTTGFCIESGIMQNDAMDELAELYLLNSEIDPSNIESIYTINKYLNYPLTEITSLSAKRIRTGLKKVSLEKSVNLEMSLENSIKRRKSIRKYTGDAIPSNYMSTILRASNGVTHTVKDSYFTRQQRTCPSGGGLYPVKLYILINKVRNQAQGVYEYDPIKDCLYLMEENKEEIDYFLKKEMLSELPNICDCTFILFITIEMWKSVSKYGSAGLRFACMEVGSISQNAHLASAALGVGSCAYASFNPKSVKQLLHIDGAFENFQHAILFGIPSGN